MKKSIVYVTVLLFTLSLVNAQGEENDIPVFMIEMANENPVTAYLAQVYDTVAINIEGERLVVVFEDSKVFSVLEDYERDTDLEITLTRAQLLYLVDNWETMELKDLFRFLIQTDMPIKDMMVIIGIAMEVRQ